MRDARGGEEEGARVNLSRARCHQERVEDRADECHIEHGMAWQAGGAIQNHSDNCHVVACSGLWPAPPSGRVEFFFAHCRGEC